MHVPPGRRIGIGTLQLAGAGGWGQTPTPAEAKRMLKSAVLRGVRVMDTAWYYGPDSVNELLAEALRPYPDDLLLIGKLGNRRDPRDHSYVPAVGHRDLRTACERTLRTLRAEAVPLLLLRWRADLNHTDAFESAWTLMLRFRAEGKARDVGLSNVTVDHITRAGRLGEVSAVSNAYSLLDRSDEHVVEHCHRNGIWFIPYYPLNRGQVELVPAVRALAAKLGATPAQLALAWLLARSPKVVPIPGTARCSQLLENIGALDIRLSGEDYSNLSEILA